jgi:hypothetical protein
LSISQLLEITNVLVEFMSQNVQSSTSKCLHRTMYVDVVPYSRVRPSLWRDSHTAISAVTQASSIMGFFMLFSHPSSGESEKDQSQNGARAAVSGYNLVDLSRITSDILSHLHIVREQRSAGKI